MKVSGFVAGCRPHGLGGVAYSCAPPVGGAWVVRIHVLVVLVVRNGWTIAVSAASREGDASTTVCAPRPARLLIKSDRTPLWLPRVGAAMSACATWRRRRRQLRARFVAPDHASVGAGHLRPGIRVTSPRAAHAWSLPPQTTSSARQARGGDEHVVRAEALRITAHPMRSPSIQPRHGASAPVRYAPYRTPRWSCRAWLQC